MSVSNATMPYQNPSLNYIQEMCRPGTIALENEFPCSYIRGNMNDPKNLKKSLFFLCSRKLLVMNSGELAFLCKIEGVSSYQESLWRYAKDNCSTHRTKSLNKSKKEFCRRAHHYMKDPQSFQAGIRKLCQYRGYSEKLDEICTANERGVSIDSKIRISESTLIRISRSLTYNKDYIELLERTQISQVKEIKKNRERIKELQNQMNILKSSGSGEEKISSLLEAIKKKNKELLQYKKEYKNTRNKLKLSLAKSEELESRVKELEKQLEELIKDREKINEIVKKLSSSGNKITFSRVLCVYLLITTIITQFFAGFYSTRNGW